MDNKLTNLSNEISRQKIEMEEKEQKIIIVSMEGSEFRSKYEKLHEDMERIRGICINTNY